MEKKIFEGTMTCKDEVDNDWSFDAEYYSFSNNVCPAIDEILDRETKNGEKFRITIEKI